MSWLLPRPIPVHSVEVFAEFFKKLSSQLADPQQNRSELCRNLLAQFLYGTTYEELLTRTPLVALNLDPQNITLEAEHYNATDTNKFARVKPLLWLWYNFDRSPAAANLQFGIELRRILAQHIFARVGKNFKCFPFVEFSVGYNMIVGDEVVIHRNVLVDDIGGVTIGDRASLSDFVNIYSHTHSVINSPDVTLKHTTIGDDVRITYHATVLAGTTLSSDSMVGTMSLVTNDIEPHTIAFGIPAKPRAKKRRKAGPFIAVQLDSRNYNRPNDRKGNPEYPEKTTIETETLETADFMTGQLVAGPTTPQR